MACHRFYDGIVPFGAIVGCRTGRVLRVQPFNENDKRFLRQVGWLGLGEASFADAVLSRCRAKLVAEGQTLYRPGEPSDGLVAVLSGALAVSVVVPEFGPTISHIMLPGAWFGEAAIVGQPRTIGVHATRDSRAGFLSVADINAIVERTPRYWTAFFRLATLSNRLAIGAGYDLMLTDKRQRCAATLLRLAGLRHSPPLTKGPVEIDITQTDLAHMANMSRNSVTHVLRDFRSAGWIDWSYGKVGLKNPAGLQQFLSSGA